MRNWRWGTAIVLLFARAALGGGISAEVRPNAVLTLLSSQLQAHPELSFDVKVWAQRVLKGELKEAGHLWSTLEPEISVDFRGTAEATYDYVLWKLGLYQTFVDAWIGDLARPGFAYSDAGKAMASVAGETLRETLEREAVRFTAVQTATLDGMPWEEPYLELKAWASLREPTHAAEALTHLPASHPWRAWLVRDAALAAAVGGKTSDAIALLESNLPALEAAKDTKTLASFSLQLARLYYQRGDLSAAKQLYEKIPNGSPEYLAAREELLWIWLRLGDVSRLRGDLKTLSLDLFDGRFAPEVYVVHAISNLKLCFFPEVEKDFRAFLKQNGVWADRIEKAMASSTPETPPIVDWYAELLTRAVQKRKAEAATLDALIRHSIAASLPAVGRQRHWSEAKDRMASEIESLEKGLGEQYHRQWRNERRALVEAIRKMRFVKVELLSQWGQGAHESPASSESSKARKEAVSAVEKDMDKKWSFPFDGVMWPDELFKLRSTAATQCL